ncbi:MAG: hypothetical protein Kow0010_13120 [Dehalococcoidia bacterium]
MNQRRAAVELSPAHAGMELAARVAEMARWLGMVADVDVREAVSQLTSHLLEYEVDPSCRAWMPDQVCMDLVVLGWMLDRMADPACLARRDYLVSLAVEALDAVRAARSGARTRSGAARADNNSIT